MKSQMSRAWEIEYATGFGRLDIYLNHCSMYSQVGQTVSTSTRYRIQCVDTVNGNFLVLNSMPQPWSIWPLRAKPNGRQAI